MEKVLSLFHNYRIWDTGSYGSFDSIIYIEIYFSISIPIMKHPVLSSSDFMVYNIKKSKTNINNSNVVKL